MLCREIQRNFLHALFVAVKLSVLRGRRSAMVAARLLIWFIFLFTLQALSLRGTKYRTCSKSLHHCTLFFRHERLRGAFSKVCNFVSGRTHSTLRDLRCKAMFHDTWSRLSFFGMNTEIDFGLYFLFCVNRTPFHQ